MSEGPWPMSEGSWIWLMARCWWPSWIQRALQLVQMAIGYRPKVMVTRADRHNGQRGMRTSRTGGGCSVVVGVEAHLGRRRLDGGRCGCGGGGVGGRCGWGGAGGRLPGQERPQLL